MRNDESDGVNTDKKGQEEDGLRRGMTVILLMRGCQKE
jgi:hypothetical protein